MQLSAVSEAISSGDVGKSSRSTSSNSSEGSTSNPFPPRSCATARWTSSWRRIFSWRRSSCRSELALHYDSRGRMVMQVAVRVPPNAPAITRSSWLAFSTPPTSSAPSP